MSDEDREPDEAERRQEAERLARERLRSAARTSRGPRDVRRGDRWLPWHFREGSSD